MAETVQVHGLRELGESLRALPKEISGKNGGPLLAALRRMGRVIQREAQALVPVDTGTLRENIIVTRAKDPKRYKATEVVHVTVRAKAKKYRDNKANQKKGRAGKRYQDYGPLYYARYQEFGTAKMAARPFMRPAFEGAKKQLPELFKSELSAAIERAVRKLNKGRRP